MFFIFFSLQQNGNESCILLFYFATYPTYVYFWTNVATYVESRKDYFWTTFATYFGLKAPILILCLKYTRMVPTNNLQTLKVCILALA